MATARDDLEREFEAPGSPALTAYQDPGGVWTIGYGHTGPDVYAGLTITADQAEALLQQDMRSFERAVENMLTRPATQDQYDALVDFAFNEGAGQNGLGGSTLLRKFNAGDLVGAARQFGEWDLSVYEGRMQVLQGLVRRRIAECVRFCGLG